MLWVFLVYWVLYFSTAIVNALTTQILRKGTLYSDIPDPIISLPFLWLPFPIGFWMFKRISLMGPPKWIWIPRKKKYTHAQLYNSNFTNYCNMALSRSNVYYIQTILHNFIHPQNELESWLEFVYNKFNPYLRLLAMFKRQHI